MQIGRGPTLVRTLIHGTRTRAVTTNGQMLATTVGTMTVIIVENFFLAMNYTGHGLSTQAVEVRRQNRGLLLRVLQQ